MTLQASQIPSAWFNLLPRLPRPPAPALHPETRAPLTPDDMTHMFSTGVVEQEFSTEPWIDIPGEIIDAYRLWRPTPLVRATRLEAVLDTPARIYFKDESVSAAGSHKLNTAVPQAYFHAKDGRRKIITETGAGQWGTALTFAANQFGQESLVYMVRSSYDQKPYRRVIMELWGGQVRPSPFDDPENPGSLSAAISEATSHCLREQDSGYTLGSVLNHVLLHQTVIGVEARDQLAALGEGLPDVVVASCGGGSNLSGITFPFVEDSSVRLLAIEPESCPTLTKGRLDYDYSDVAGHTPLMEMYTLGNDFMPPRLHAAGLRFHGVSPLVSVLVRDGRMEARAVPQPSVFEAAATYAKTQGQVAAPETGHAIRGVIDEAVAAREAGEERVILSCFSGHGHFDLAAYDEHLQSQRVVEPA